MRLFPSAAAVLFLLPAAVSASRNVDEAQTALHRYERQLAEQREKLKGLVGQGGRLLKEVDGFSRAINRIEAEIASLFSERDKIDRESLSAAEDIARLNEAVRSRSAAVSHWLRALYVGGRPNSFEVLLSCETPAERRARQFVVKRWIARDKELIGEFRKHALERDATRALLVKAKADRERVLASLDGKRKAQVERRESQERLLSLIRTQEDFYRQSISDLEQASKNLEKLLDTLKRQQDEGESRFASFKGKLPLPVPGKLLRPFGPFVDPKLKIRLYHKGIDLSGRPGDLVRSVFDGKVVFSGWFTGYGNILIVDHGGGYFTLYAHASRLFKRAGDPVVTGEPIAAVGDTGSMRGPLLYFELRNKGISENPWPWFASG